MTDVIGRRLGKLRVMRRDETRRGYYLCDCDCGTKGHPVSVSNMRGKRPVRSCGRCRAPRDLTGTRFGRLVVLDFSHRNKTHYFWKCECDCGELVVVERGKLTCKKRPTRSCGCLIAEAASKRATHGHMRGYKPTPTYNTYRAMIERCHDPKNKSYERYGAIGVTVCDRWRESFENFLADMGERPAARTLDRIDPHGNYEPGNCRWATIQEQRMNRRK